MTQLLDIKAFLTTARSGSFSAAGREIGIAPSVITKRVSRLEHDIGSPLFVRSTRRLTLTAEGERLRPRLQLLIGELQETLKGAQPAKRGLSGQLRIKAPTTLGTMFLGEMIAGFQAKNPNLTCELMMIDRAVNPLEEGFDLALGALPISYSGVIDTPLCHYQRTLVAAPDYLARQGSPSRPNDIVEHDCIAFVPAGLSWSFDSAKGTVVVDIHATFTVNDNRVQRAAALAGIGLTVMPAFMAKDDIAANRLVEVMQDYPVTPLWLKAMVPRNKKHKPEVTALLNHLITSIGSVPPWEV